MIKQIARLLGIFKDKSNKSLTKQTIESSAFLFSTSIISKLGGLVFSILLARILLPDLYGLYSLVFSVIATIAAFTDLGINTALSKYLAESLSKGKRYEAEARSRTRFLFSLKIILALVISLILFMGASLISNLIFHKPEMIFPLKIGAIYLFAMSIQGFLGTIFYPIKKIKYNAVSEIILQISKIGIFLLLILMYKTVSNVFLSLALAYTVSILFYIVVLVIKKRKLFFGALTPIDRRKISIFLGWSILLSAFSSLYASVNTIMLGFFVENNFIAYYSVMLSIILPISTLFNMGNIFLPLFTEIRKDRLKRGFEKITKYSAILSIPASVGLAFILIPILRVIYGANYVPQEFYFPILFSSILLSMLIFEESIMFIFIPLLIAKEKLNLLTINFFIMNILNITLNYCLIKITLPYGQIWTIIAVSGVTVLIRYLNMLYLQYLAKKEFNLKLNGKLILKPLFASLIMLGFLLAFNFLFNPGLILTIIMVVLAAVVYAVVLSLIKGI